MLMVVRKTMFDESLKNDGLFKMISIEGQKNVCFRFHVKKMGSDL
jgi:hypothetical protein